ncbi:hypothetical protein DYBT9623_03405 [Dyadobacter sp. CECT 9623]|uniref:DUF2911 domain-containing protein n=1 Tax=Dyadobacter linearis TaxID=2823330 RepID=A0ABM8USY4_9BACT|nr:DUF2911 domain-containing protein [Dyadobacter sp. CECT 9623]CAG5071360.1 hypothetical protein DYBT9623_03405 [Dyadobacter sp. CECT 9623]
MKKNIFLSLLLVMIAFASQAQKFKGLDKSPRDVAYFPDGFAHDRKDGDKALVKVSYSRPALKGREVFGKLEPFGKVWRVGADEATEIKFYQDATFGGKKVKAGTYSLFAIPNAKEWTLILSSDVDYWGAYKYKEANDVARVTVPVKSAEAPIENFSIVFEKSSDTAAKMFLGWDKTIVEVPVTF